MQKLAVAALVVLTASASGLQSDNFVAAQINTKPTLPNVHARRGGFHEDPIEIRRAEGLSNSNIVSPPKPKFALRRPKIPSLMQEDVQGQSNRRLRAGKKSVSDLGNHSYEAESDGNQVFRYSNPVKSSSSNSAHRGFEKKGDGEQARPFKAIGSSMSNIVHRIYENKDDAAESSLGTKTRPSPSNVNQHHIYDEEDEQASPSHLKVGTSRSNTRHRAYDDDNDDDDEGEDEVLEQRLLSRRNVNRHSFEEDDDVQSGKPPSRFNINRRTLTLEEDDEQFNFKQGPSKTNVNRPQEEDGGDGDEQFLKMQSAKRPITVRQAPTPNPHTTYDEDGEQFHIPLYSGTSRSSVLIKAIPMVGFDEEGEEEEEAAFSKVATKRQFVNSKSSTLARKGATLFEEEGEDGEEWWIFGKPKTTIIAQPSKGSIIQSSRPMIAEEGGEVDSGDGQYRIREKGTSRQSVFARQFEPHGLLEEDAEQDQADANNDFFEGDQQEQVVLQERDDSMHTKSSSSFFTAPIRAINWVSGFFNYTARQTVNLPPTEASKEVKRPLARPLARFDAKTNATKLSPARFEESEYLSAEDQFFDYDEGTGEQFSPSKGNLISSDLPRDSEQQIGVTRRNVNPRTYDDEDGEQYKPNPRPSSFNIRRPALYEEEEEEEESLQYVNISRPGLKPVHSKSNIDHGTFGDDVEYRPSGHGRLARPKTDGAAAAAPITISESPHAGASKSNIPRGSIFEQVANRKMTHHKRPSRASIRPVTFDDSEQSNQFAKRASQANIRPVVIHELEEDEVDVDVEEQTQQLAPRSQPIKTDRAVIFGKAAPKPSSPKGIKSGPSKPNSSNGLFDDAASEAPTANVRLSKSNTPHAILHGQSQSPKIKQNDFTIGVSRSSITRPGILDDEEQAQFTKFRPTSNVTAHGNAFSSKTNLNPPAPPTHDLQYNSKSSFGPRSLEQADKVSLTAISKGNVNRV